MAGIDYDPNAVQAAINHLKAGLDEIDNNGSNYLLNLQTVQRPGDAPETKAYHHSLLGTIGDQQHGTEEGRKEIQQAIAGLEAVQRQYASGEELTAEGFTNKGA
ncbi:MAG: hypothetical protein ACRDRL_23440 [Sciscionella sp.]